MTRRKGQFQPGNAAHAVDGEGLIIKIGKQFDMLVEAKVRFELGRKPTRKERIEACRRVLSDWVLSPNVVEEQDMANKDKKPKVVIEYGGIEDVGYHMKEITANN